MGLAIWGALASFGHADEAWTYLDNGEIRLGVNRSAGASIGWFSASGSTENVLNHYDHGRYLQQSWYGDEDGSDWNGKPWRWNPVQGGGWRGEPAEVLEFREISASGLFARTRPRHWATGKAIEDVVFEESIQLEGKVARILFRMTYSGAKAHAPRHQELPAVFVDSRLSTLVCYAGDRPWTGGELARSVPGWPNESRKIAEPWAAYIDPATDRGVGVMVPGVSELTCYRFGEMGKKEACSYFAPIKTLAVIPGFSFDYEVRLTLGTVEEIRERFKAIK
ncbi:MAG: hypothetical protein KDM63_08985 [Verrucomicrobiae bacterium]|nr:hypothetical protein [Verrucomicrobiae bacterium]